MKKLCILLLLVLLSTSNLFTIYAIEDFVDTIPEENIVQAIAIEKFNKFYADNKESETFRDGSGGALTLWIWAGGNLSYRSVMGILMGEYLFSSYFTKTTNILSTLDLTAY